MKMKLGLLTAILLLLAPALMAQPGMCGPGHGPGRGMGQGMGRGCCPDDGDGIRPMMLIKMAEEIGLTEEQKGKIEALNETHRMACIDRKAEMEKAELKLRSLMRNDAPDREILAAIDKLGVLKTEMKKAQFTHQRQAKGILNAEQIKKLKELRAKMRCDGDGREVDVKIIKEIGGGQGMRPDAPDRAGLGCNRPCILHGDGE